MAQAPTRPLISVLPSHENFMDALDDSMASPVVRQVATRRTYTPVP